MGEESQHVRVIARAHRVEVYVKDRWLFGVSLTARPRAGGVGLLVDGGRAVFRRVRLAALEPLRRPEGAK